MSGARQGGVSDYAGTTNDPVQAKPWEKDLALSVLKTTLREVLARGTELQHQLGAAENTITGLRDELAGSRAVIEKARWWQGLALMSDSHGFQHYREYDNYLLAILAGKPHPGDAPSDEESE